MQAARGPVRVSLLFGQLADEVEQGQPVEGAVSPACGQRPMRAPGGAGGSGRSLRRPERGHRSHCGTSCAESPYLGRRAGVDAPFSVTGPRGCILAFGA